MNKEKLTRSHKGNDRSPESLYKFWGHFRYSRAANSTVSGPIWIKIELIHNITYAIITCKFKKYRMNSNRENMETSFFRHSRAAYPLVSHQILPKFKLVQAVINVLITFKYQKDRVKNDQETMKTSFSSLEVHGVIFRLSRADNSIVGGPILPKFELEGCNTVFPIISLWRFFQTLKGT